MSEQTQPEYFRVSAYTAPEVHWRPTLRPIPKMGRLTFITKFFDPDQEGPQYSSDLEFQPDYPSDELHEPYFSIYIRSENKKVVDLIRNWTYLVCCGKTLVEWSDYQYRRQFYGYGSYVMHSSSSTCGTTGNVNLQGRKWGKAYREGASFVLCPKCFRTLINSFGLKPARMEWKTGNSPRGNHKANYLERFNIPGGVQVSSLTIPVHTKNTTWSDDD